MGAFLVNRLAGRRGENSAFFSGFITRKVNGFFTYAVLAIGLTRSVTLGEAMCCLHLRDTKKISKKYFYSHVFPILFNFI